MLLGVTNKISERNRLLCFKNLTNNEITIKLHNIGIGKLANRKRNTTDNPIESLQLTLHKHSLY